jgi:hypothetical protein
MLSHRINEQSPLLTRTARDMIKANGGFWPPELNTADGVRAALAFDQILVSLCGTSNADAKKVFAHKCYDYVDMNVGYRFVNMLYYGLDEETLNVDHELLNDLHEQVGGGGEQLEAHGEKQTEILL